MRQLQPCDKSLQTMEGPRLQKCVFKNDVDGVPTCLRNDIMAWNTRDINGMTPLMVAATLNRTEILQILINVKCDVNATDENGNTALHLAVDEGNTDIVRKLVRSGRCIVDATNVNGETALMRAAFYDYHESAKLILKEGQGNPDIRNRTGQSALLIALQEGSHMTADILLKHGCDVMIADDLGRSALFMAIHSPLMKSLETAKTLIAAGYDITVDRIWLLNEEKHNIFYQDDDFYTTLRQQLRKNSVGCHNYLRRISSADGGYQSLTSPPESSKDSRTPSPTIFTMSPTLKEKIMSSSGSPNFAPIPFSKITSSYFVDPMSSNVSTTDVRRSLYKTSTSAKHSLTSSSESEDSVIGSQGSCDNMTSYSQFPGRVCCYQNAENRRKQFNDKNTCNQFPISRKAGKYSSHDEDKDHISPMVKYKRQVSAQPAKKDSQLNLTSRKISLPTKPVVQFCTEIQIYEINRH